MRDERRLHLGKSSQKQWQELAVKGSKSDLPSPGAVVQASSSHGSGAGDRTGNGSGTRDGTGATSHMRWDVRPLRRLAVLVTGPKGEVAHVQLISHDCS